MCCLKPLLFICAVCQLLVHQISAFIPVILRNALNANRNSYNIKGQDQPQKSLSIVGGGSSSDLDREMDKFFELAAESGSENTRKITPEERVERVIRGEALENEIFDLRSELMALEDAIFANNAPVDAPAMVKEMRVKMESLKDEYRDIVGAKDLPLYFGRLADSMQ
jgi:hypothetical protein